MEVDKLRLSFNVSRETKNMLAFLQSYDVARGHLSQAEVIEELVQSRYNEVVKTFNFAENLSQKENTDGK